MSAASCAQEAADGAEWHLQEVAPWGLCDWVKSSPVQWLRLWLYVYRFFQYVMRSTVPQVAV